MKEKTASQRSASPHVQQPSAARVKFAHTDGDSHSDHYDEEHADEASIDDDNAREDVFLSGDIVSDFDVSSSSVNEISHVSWRMETDSV